MKLGMHSCRVVLAVCLASAAVACVADEGDGVAVGSVEMEVGTCGPTRPATPADPATPPPQGGCADDFAYADVSGHINGAPVTGSNVGAADTFDASCAFDLSGDVPFEITPAVNGTITIRTGHPGTDYDTVVAVRALCDDANVDIACNDDCGFPDLTSCLSFHGIAGQTYLVYVTGYAFNEGSFEMSITQEEGRPGAIPAAPATPSDHAIPGGDGHPAIPPSACGHHLCDRGGPLEACCSWCVADICAVDPYCCDVAWDGICVGEVFTVCDRDACLPPCGDGICAFGEESCATCAADCGECPPPPVCGDQFCDFDENCFSCPGDCGECPPPPPPGCGDGSCAPDEDCGSCPGDCGECPPPP